MAWVIAQLRGETMTISENTVGLVSQSESGAIISYVERGGERRLDQNNFITALWLRELRMRGLDQLSIFDKPQALALDYLENSASTVSDNAQTYGFWSEQLRPEWLARIPDDIDDTAIVNNELLLAGRISSKTLKRNFYHILNSVRVPKHSVYNSIYRPSWVSPGCYYTWLPSTHSQENIIDVCANTNVVALLAKLNAKTAPGYQAACETIFNAIKWATKNVSRLPAITPYYPSPFELFFALEHAIQCGAHELIASHELLRSLLEDACIKPTSAICSSVFGNTVWSCDAIDGIRNQEFNFITYTSNSKQGSALCKY